MSRTAGVEVRRGSLVSGSCAGQAAARSVLAWRLLCGPRDVPQTAAPPLLLWLAFLGVFLLSGCHHQAQVAYAPPPPAAPRARALPAASSRGGGSAAEAPQPWPAMAPGDLEAEASAAPPGFFDDFHAVPVFTETGLASWYGPNYHHHAAADGTIYDQNGMTAAHRTLPLGSTVRVTNVQTGEQVLVRITDRGPFAPGRVVDLSAAAARAIGVYRLGIAPVRVEAFPHASADPAGRWCVQTGAFATETDATDLKAALTDRYRTAKIVEFQGPTGFWVRIDPVSRTKAQAAEILDWIGQPDPMAHPYLVRTD